MGTIAMIFFFKDKNKDERIAKAKGKTEKPGRKHRFKIALQHL